MEPLIVIVGFLGAGKTTLLKRLVGSFLHSYWNPFVILNDYQNAYLDAQYFLNEISSNSVHAIGGSCICCSGVNELRQAINQIPRRNQGITFLEANGTTDACMLLGFLGVGLKDQFLPPIQLAVVDVRNWQERGANNELEAQQVLVASVVVFNHTAGVSGERKAQVRQDISDLNPGALITDWKDLDAKVLPLLRPLRAPSQSSMDHPKSHWSSCSIDLPENMEESHIRRVLKQIPQSVLRVKGCTKLSGDEKHTFFERIPSGELFFRPFEGPLVSGPKLLMIGPGCDPVTAKKWVEQRP